MLLQQHDRRLTPMRRPPPAPVMARSRSRAIAPVLRPVAAAGAPLAATLARAVSRRALQTNSWQQPGAAPLQREVVHEDSWIDSAYDAVADMIGSTGNAVSNAVANIQATATAIVDGHIDWIANKIAADAQGLKDSAASPEVKAKAVAQLITYREARAGTYGWPDRNAWHDDPGLYPIRAGKLLLKRGSSNTGSVDTLRLVKQFIRAWGCDMFELDLLPKGGTGGPFGPETEAAIRKFQLFRGLDGDGIVGPKTMQKLDEWMGMNF